ncbi:MAG: nucleotide exchange factor GrpE [Candidatus Geothermincolia bacterium]
MTDARGPRKQSRDDSDRKAGRVPGKDEDEVEIIEGGSDADETEAIEVEPEERIHALDSEVDELADEKALLLDSLQRLKADFDNYRKRMLKEQTRILETAEADLLKKLLPVIDNLERALDSSPEGDARGLREGVGKVLELMRDILGKEGLEVIDPGGEPFDPEHHEAMMVVETSECPEGTIVDVVQKGYRFNGVLLRPAMVRVACPVKG